MKIFKAYCVELSRSINIVDARNAYFRQSAPRKRFVFLCSSPECQALGKVLISGVNYDKVAEDSPKFQAAHFRGIHKELHSPACKWVIEDDAMLNKPETGRSPSKRSPNKQVDDDYIRRATFLAKGEPKVSSGVDSEKIEDSENSLRKSTKSNSAKRIKRESKKPSDGRVSSSFSELVTDYLEIHRDKAWSTPLSIKGLPIETYGQFFKKVEWYDEDYRENHAYYGSVEVVKVYPDNFDFEPGVLLSGVNLRFEQEVTVDGLDRNPSLYIKKEDFEKTRGAHVLAESINLALNDKSYYDTLWCHFYGRIVTKDVPFTDKKTGNIKTFETLNVIPESMNMLN